ncbi:MAG: UDP-N-acetylmuramoylalanine--D-glutamate ligase, partial [Oscillospiraceae bacterium]|nr:UDP-N-acetylmuramoylalanine--D-glutamate ligase [Oscillospiraceae bacterium]
IEQIRPDDVAVVELSSFQLISMRQSPDIAVITNIAPNHLDVHKDMDEYIEAKCNLIWHQNAFSKTILNMDNEITDGLSRFVRGKLVNFSRRQTPKTGAFLGEDGYIYMVNNDEKQKIMHKDEIKLPGIHNVENYLAAISAVYDIVDVDNIKKVAQNFGGVEHRIELVRKIDGVVWYNDSIATSPTRTIAGLNAFNQKLIVIAGGYDKKIPFEPLAPKIIEKVKVLILTGLTAPKIEKAIMECEGYNPNELKIIHVSSMEQAVKTAREIAKDGDIVTLSPACASFDSYPNFEVRGNHYKQLVHAL